MVCEYRKLIVALVGLSVLLLHRYHDVDLLGTEPLIVDIIISGATAFSVWLWPNGQARGPQ